MRHWRSQKSTKMLPACVYGSSWNLAETFRLALGNGYDRLTAGDMLELEDEYGSLVLTPDFVEAFAAFDLLGKVNSLEGVPLLLVHGADDAVVPLCQAEEIFAVAGQPKEMVIIPGGDHQFLATHQIATDAVLAWLSRMFFAKVYNHGLSQY